MTTFKIKNLKPLITFIVIIHILFSCTKFTYEYFENAKVNSDFPKLIEMSIIKNKYRAKAIIYIREYLENLRGKIVNELSNEIINDEIIIVDIKNLKKLQEKIVPYLLTSLQNSKDLDKISRVVNLVSLIALDESSLQLYMLEKKYIKKIL